MMYSFRLLLLLMLVLPTASFGASVVQNDKVRAELLADTTSHNDSGAFWAAVELTMPPEWHVYWQNPGDSGIETRLEWTLPAGVTAGPIHWQPPQRIEYSGLVNYGYGNKTALLVPITRADAASGEPFTLQVKADWLVCKDICIPEAAVLDLTVDPAQGDAHASSVIDEYVNHLPKLSTEQGQFAAVDKLVEIFLVNPLNDQLIESVWWYPLDDGIIDNAGAQQWRLDTDRLVISASRGYGNLIDSYHGLLEVKTKNGNASHWVFNLSKSDSAAIPSSSASVTVPEESGMTLLVALLSAFLGGLTLNIMPCVLPILSLKALGVAKKAAHNPAAVRKIGIAYTAGILVSFAAIAGALIVVQQAGGAVGWGFQLQSPLFVTSLIYILFLVGLNLSGLFELPVLGGNSALASRDDAIGSFFTGVLATIVATPCTAPFMATALGFALGQPPVAALLIFLCLGLGLAFPFLLISFVPPLYRHLPKPGAWMIRFRQFLAFPIYASAAWLLWVLVQQTGPMGLAAALAGICLLAFAAWLLPLLGARRGVQWVTALIIAVLVIKTIDNQSAAEAPAPMSVPMQHEVFSQVRLDALRAEKKTVFVDATAAWCLTCKVNERIALASDSVKQAFSDRGVVTLVADWTNRDPEITAYLQSFGRNGVPIYVFYPESGEPVVLPQLLTPQIVLDAMMPVQK